MSRAFAFVAATVALAAPQPAAAAISNCLPDGQQLSGAVYRICMPEAGRWNGDLVMFAHGYVSITEPVGIPEDQLALPNGTSLPQLVNALGYAFAVTSYSKNGLAVLPGIADLRDLVTIFNTTVAPARRVFLVGASEGGIITALAMERHPETFAGGLSACGPIGDFRAQINYIGDFRVVFDVLFPGFFPGSATHVPRFVLDHWDSVYVPALKQLIATQPYRIGQLLKVTRTPIGLDPATIEQSVIGVLWYAIFATNDAAAVLGGQPFSNKSRWYSGSDNDLLLNLLVERAEADPAALTEVRTNYQTSGGLQRPVVTLHTLGDPIIPYWHQPLYRAKVGAAGSDSRHDNIPVLRYGHCEFRPAEAVLGFALLVARANGAALQNIGAALSDPDARAEYDALAQRYGLAQ